MALQLEKTTREDIERLVAEYVERHVEQRVEARLRQLLAEDPAAKRVAIIASRGTLDMAYPPLILASTAAAMGMAVGVFFTFYGLQILKKHLKLAVDPVGNPAMPMPVPNIVSVLPGMRAAATRMMEGMFRKHKVPSIEELRQMCLDAGVRLVACQMTMEVMGIRREDLIDGIEVAGAASFLSEASQAHVTAFI